MQSCSGITRSAAEAGPHRNPLRETQVDCETMSRRFQNPQRRLHCKILFGRADFRAADIDGDAAAFPPLRSQAIRETDQAEESLDSVIAIVLTGEHPQQEVDLCQGVERYSRGGHAGVWRRLLKPPGVRARDQSPSRVIGKNEVT